MSAAQVQEVHSALQSYDDEVLLAAFTLFLEQRPELKESLLSALSTAASERYIGTIKQFDPSKGCGFIDCQDTEAIYGLDVWIQSPAIGTLKVGSIVEFSVRLNKAGNPQAEDLQDLSGIAAGDPSAMAPQPQQQQQQRLQQGFSQQPPQQQWQQPQQQQWQQQQQQQPQQWQQQQMQQRPLQQQQQQMQQPQQWQQQQQQMQQQQQLGSGLEQMGFESGPEGELGGPPADGLDGDTSGLPRHVGSIKWFEPGKKFGFIASPTIMQEYGRDAFVSDQAIGPFVQGSTVSFVVRQNAQGNPQAADLQAADEDGLPGQDLLALAESQLGQGQPQDMFAWGKGAAQPQAENQPPVLVKGEGSTASAAAGRRAAAASAAAAAVVAEVAAAVAVAAVAAAAVAAAAVVAADA
eukprot:CAMPEP_0203860084 /NCGR_PEP_ID=MMETSP0359-20131031/12225_1 /ASSEMBLY_ACC=CAM_ASM_000338 /TAXON_ID=268821 /ORGANISM="Scrippsiella Hangoei, Strain SHTV-5" /LENGTH=406 /DNA_ID=CAMNT_0050777103 /DNA_START=59 /DNA_END=1276 /DNA_ORIENTATION=+